LKDIQLVAGCDPKRQCRITPAQSAESTNQGNLWPTPILCTEKTETDFNHMKTDRVIYFSLQTYVITDEAKSNEMATLRSLSKIVQIGTNDKPVAKQQAKAQT
jgi:hypothetical protein